ncbi:MAG: 3-deoxy-D-manno-octulosonic acid transferase, partial [Bacteroidales bacterium]|nr:3-deoxy-D-manno-octulosonic acid transferase [Bacteroidales bacterium]
QARQLIESFKDHFPEYKILLTFFSPSGYETRKDYDKADRVFYLPMDTKSNAKKFISVVKPELVFFIKYEFWFNYLSELKKNNVPTFLVSAIFRPDQHFFRFFGGWFRSQLNNITYFFVQNETSLNLLKSINIDRTELTGDTRFDRVFKIAVESKEFPLIKVFKHDNHLLLAGSTWNEDEEILLEFHKNFPKFKLIIAPHEVHDLRIQKLLKRSGNDALLFSKANDISIRNAKILIIDSIGILSHMYKYADMAYIGGGFGTGIHNILEAATFGQPVFFGPNYQKFQEARDLIDKGGAFTIKNSIDLINKIQPLLDDKNKLNETGSICRSYVTQKRGATEKILEYIRINY